MKSRYRKYSARTQSGSLVWKIALGVVLGSIMLWGIGIAMGIGTLALFANAFEQAMNQISSPTSKPNPKVSQLDITQQYRSSSAPINPIAPQSITKNIQQGYIDSAQRSQKAINEKLKEYNNIVSSNEYITKNIRIALESSRRYLISRV